MQHIGKITRYKCKKVGLATVSVAHKGVAGAAVPNYFYYNISQFLDDVKGAFDVTFSNDVYLHFAKKQKI